MKKLTILVCMAAAMLFCLSQSAYSGRGYMGGKTSPAEPVDEGTGDDGGGVPGTVDGPLNDKGSTQGTLYGDLYVIRRYKGGEIKNVPKVDDDGNPVMIESFWYDNEGNLVTSDGSDDPDMAILVDQQAWDTATAIGGEPILTENFVNYTVADEETGELMINPLTGGTLFAAPYPSQCVQPVASYAKWGDIERDYNALPLMMTYDPTWNRTEAEVDPGYFIEQGGTWTSPTGVGVIFDQGVLWTAMIQEVHFGRLSIARAPDHVLKAAFDEAILTINSAEKIRLDASGRLLLTRTLTSATQFNADGTPVTTTIEKAIDSPRENIALYIKLLKDGHLVTPGDERMPIDRSSNGGIPLDKQLELEGGPSKALRPTIDIDKMKKWGLGDLVDVEETTYYTYTENGVLNVVTACPGETDCEEWEGILTADGSGAEETDFVLSAAFLAASADKTGVLTQDQIVYLNSILGINKVVGYSDYNDDGTPAEGAINYSLFPEYFDFSTYPTYIRTTTFANRGHVTTDDLELWDAGSPAYSGEALVLRPGGPLGTGTKTWVETLVTITSFPFMDWGIDLATEFPNGQLATTNIAGFCQEADDNLSVINYVHTYQIPGLR